MADKIRYEDIIDQSVQRQLDELTATIKELTTELNKLSTATQKEDTAAEEYNDTLRSEVEIADDLLRLTRDQIGLKKEIKRTTEQHTAAQKAETAGAEHLAVAVNVGKEELSKNNRELKNAAKLALANKGSMTELSLELAKNRTKYRELTKAQRENKNEGVKLLKTINKQDKAIKKLDSSIGNHQRNVGNYTGALSSMGGTFGMLGAKITQVSTIFVTLGGAMKAATAATTLTSKAMKILRLALISTGIGAIVVALGTLISYFTSAAEGSAKFRKALAPLKAILSTITNIIQTFGEGMYDIINGNFAEGWNKITTAVSNANVEFERQLTLQRELAEVENARHSLRRDTTVAIARVEMELQNQRKIAHDAEKFSVEERLAAQRNVLRLAEFKGKLEIELLEKEIKAAELRSQMAQDSEEEEQALQDLYAQRYVILGGVNKRMATYQSYVETLTGKLNSQADAQIRVNQSITAMTSEIPETIKISGELDTTLRQQSETTKIVGEQSEITAGKVIGASNASLNAAFGASEQNKDMQTAQALINTFAAVGIALATPGNIYSNFITAGVALAAGLANVVKLQNTPAYSEGIESVPQTGMALIHENERILPSHINKQLGSLPNDQVPGLINLGLKMPQLQTGINELVGLQRESNKIVSRWAWVDNKGTVHHLSGDKTYYN